VHVPSSAERAGRGWARHCDQAQGDGETTEQTAGGREGRGREATLADLEAAGQALAERLTSATDGQRALLPAPSSACGHGWHADPGEALREPAPCGSDAVSASLPSTWDVGAPHDWAGTSCSSGTAPASSASPLAAVTV